MKPYLVKFWHGYPQDKAFAFFRDRIEKITVKEEGQTNVFFKGTLDEFAQKYNDKFLYYPPLERERECISGTIFVTHYANFAQR